MFTLSCYQSYWSFLEQLVPANFREALGAAAALLAVVFLFISLVRSQRDHGLRATGLLLLCTIVLFAHHYASYFAAVFIVATAVTQLEFLQNLAAILRGGSKEYFKYRREFVPRQQVEAEVADELVAGEAAAAEAAPDAAQPAAEGQPQEVPPERRMSTAQFAVLVEELAFRFLERRYGRPIERHIRFVGSSESAEFDGVMREGDFDRVFEVKSSRLNIFPQHFLADSVRLVMRRLSEYQRITGRRAALSVVLVGNFSPNFHRRIREYRESIVAEFPASEIQFETLTFDEIGLSAADHQA